MNVSREQVLGWFQGKKPEVIDRRSDGSVPGRKPPEPKSVLQRAAAKVRRLLFA